jgi:hypothetical protein
VCRNIKVYGFRVKGPGCDKAREFNWARELNLSREPRAGDACAEPPKAYATIALSKKDKEERKRMIEPEPPPRYDDVFRKVLAALDLDAGTPLESE